MNENDDEEKSKYIISYKDYFFGFLSSFWKYPRFYRASYKLQKMKPDKKYSIGRLIEKIANKYPNQYAIFYEDQKYTYLKFNEIVNQYANYFLSIGIKKGDIINLFIENRPELIFIITAFSKIGVIGSLINTNQKRKSLEHSFTIKDVKSYIIGEEVYKKFKTVLPNLDLNDEIKYILYENNIVSVSDDFINLKKAIESQPKYNPPTSKNIQLKDTYLYIFTSGTTGLPKAVPITNHRTIGASIFYGYQLLRMTPNDVIYSPLPFYHGNAINVGWASALGGASTIVIKRKFSVSEFWDDIRKYGATTFNYIGELCRYLLNQTPNENDKNHNVKRITGNGLRPEIWKQFKERFGIEEIYEFYGTTEFSSVFYNILNLDCTLGINFDPYKIVKYNIEQNEIEKDQNGELIEVQEGEAGLLLMKIIDTHYYAGYTNKEATRRKIIENPFGNNELWFNTGDMLRKIGYHHTQFVDRLGDTFRWKSENVSAKEVEEIIANFDQIDFAAVYGVKIPGTEGRIGMASLLLNVNQNDFNFSEFHEHLTRNLPKYAFPYFLRFLTKIEFTDTAKIKKAELKKEGYNIQKIDDDIFILLLENDNYVRLNNKIYNGIIDKIYRF